MSTIIHEFFGFSSTDGSPLAADHVSGRKCPFIADTCVKTLRDGTVAGVCSLKPATSPPVICCPIRLYADDYRILYDVAEIAFGEPLPMYPGAEAQSAAGRSNAHVIAVFGKRWGGELRLPQRAGRGSYYVDWILARLDSGGRLLDFVAIEVQSIDTTGNYRIGIDGLLATPRTVTRTSAGLNWENVNKRILPQVIYKGNVLQRESLCRSGLFFIIPVPVYTRIMDRLGGKERLLEYPLQSSSITFLAYDLDANNEEPGRSLPIRLMRRHTTNLVQVAQAFAGPGDMPAPDIYRYAIEGALA